MDTMSSAEFRKRYAKLLRPTVVTVNGHAIGSWVPVDTYMDFLPELEAQAAEATKPTEALEFLERYNERFNSRPFTPVPKVKK